MTSNSDWNSSTSGTVVAYFLNGEDAQNAIDELVDKGFPINEIGAAFHSASSAPATGISTASAVRPFQDDLSTVGSVGSGARVSGAESGTSGVTPAGLSTGAGTGFSGASRPGPIPGSEIPADLPTNIPSTLRSATTAPLGENTETRVPYSTGPVITQAALHARRSDADASWWDKLKHLFSGESEASASFRREPIPDSSTNFGTGEGNLGIASEFEYPYSGAAFESSFAGMGIPQTDARRLAGEIRRGGAIVTVSAGPLNADAEQILERNHGRIRYEDTFVDEGWETDSDTGRVQIFGRVQRAYPGYVSPGEFTRKAS